MSRADDDRKLRACGSWLKGEQEVTPLPEGQPNGLEAQIEATREQERERRTQKYHLIPKNDGETDLLSQEDDDE